MINCIIIDDEPLALKGLKEYINDIDFLHLVGEFDNAMKTLPLLKSEKVDLIFLDIEMPQISGLDFLKSLPHPPLIIITTAYPQHAVEGFELNVIDYLLKPIAFNRFLKAALKAQEVFSHSDQALNEEKTTDHIFVKSNNKIVKIFFEDIIYAEALQNYVAIHTANGKIITYLTFKSVEENLPASLFLKVHKSYIVRLSKITGIGANLIYMDEIEIPISRSLKEEVTKKLLGSNFLKR